MIYTPRSQSIEAAPVELAGQRLMAVEVGGKAHLMDAAAFEILFTADQATPPTEERGVGEKNQRAMPCADLKPKGSRISDVAQRCLDILQQHGPLTTAELRDHVYRDEKDHRKRLQNFSALSLDMKRKRLIERRTDASTQLDKWHLV